MKMTKLERIVRITPSLDNEIRKWVKRTKIMSGFPVDKPIHPTHKHTRKHCMDKLSKLVSIQPPLELKRKIKRKGYMQDD